MEVTVDFPGKRPQFPPSLLSSLPPLSIHLKRTLIGLASVTHSSLVQWTATYWQSQGTTELKMEMLVEGCEGEDRLLSPLHHQKGKIAEGWCLLADSNRRWTIYHHRIHQSDSSVIPNWWGSITRPWKKTLQIYHPQQTNKRTNNKTIFWHPTIRPKYDLRKLPLLQTAPLQYALFFTRPGLAIPHTMSHIPDLFLPCPLPEYYLCLCITAVCFMMTAGSNLYYSLNGLILLTIPDKINIY